MHGQCAALAAQGAAAVVQRLPLGVHAQRAADHATGPVGQPRTLQVRRAARLEDARVVVQRPADLRAQVAAGHHRAGTAVVQRARRQQQLAAAGDHAVGVVVQRPVHLHLQGAAGGGHDAALVRQTGRVELPRATQQQLALLVLHILGDTQPRQALARRLHAALRVKQALRVQGQHAVAPDRAAGIVQRAANGEVQCLSAAGGQVAASSAERAGGDRDGLRRGGAMAQVGVLPGDAQGAIADDAAAAATQRIRRNLQLPVAGVLDRALDVVQRCRLHGQIAIAGHGAAGVVQCLRVQHAGGIAAGHDPPTCAVVQRAGLHLEAGRAQGALALIHRVGRQGQRGAADDAALRVGHAVGGERQSLAASVAEGAVGVDQLVRADGQQAAVAGHGALGIVQLPAHHDVALGTARRSEGAAAVGQRAGLQDQRTIAGDAAAVVVQRTAQVQRHGLVSGGHHVTARGIQGVGDEGDLFGLGRATRAQFQIAAAQLQAPLRQHLAAGAMQGLRGHAQGAVAGVLDCAQGVVQCRRAHADVAAGGQATALAVIQQARRSDLQRRTASGEHAAAAIEHAVGLDHHRAIGRQCPGRVVQGAADGQLRPIVAGRQQRAAAIVQRAGLQGDPRVTEQATAMVVHGTLHLQGKRLRAQRSQLAASGAQAIGVDADPLRRRVAPAQVDCTAAHRQSAVAEQATTAAGQTAGGDAQHPATSLLHLAVGIAKGSGPQAQIAIAGNAATGAVVQQIAHLHAGRLRAGGQQAAAAVIQAIGLHIQHAGARRGGAMVDAASPPYQRTRRGDLAAGTGPVLRGQAQPLGTAVGDVPIDVDHRLRVQLPRRRVAGQHAASVVQQALHVPGGRIATAMAQAATLVAQRSRVQAQRVGHVQMALVVDQRTELQIRIAVHRQGAGLVAQVSAHAQRGHAQTSGAVIQPGSHRHGDRASTIDAPAVVIERTGDAQQACGQRRASRGLAAAGVWRRAATRRVASAAGAGAAARPSARASSGGRRVPLPVAAGHHPQAALGAVAQAAGIHSQCLQAGLLDLAALVAQRRRRDLQALRIERAAAVVHIRRGVDLQGATRTDHAGIGNAAAGRDLRVLLRLQRAAVLQTAIDGDDQLARLRAQVARVAHTHAVLVADQPDLVGEHATQRPDIQRERRCRAAGRLRGDLVLVGANHVAAEHRLHLIGPDPRVDLHCTRQQAGVVGATAIQAGAHDLDRPAAHPIPIQRTVGDQRCAGGQCDPAGVEEAAAIDLDARRIGDDHFRPRPGHFHVATQVANRPVDLVEDHLGTGGQPRIALHPTAQLGLALHGGVVEDRSLPAHVELTVAVARYPRRRGRGDVHQRHAIGGVEHRRALRAGRIEIAHDAPHRLRLHRTGHPHTCKHPAQRPAQASHPCRARVRATQRTARRAAHLFGSDLPHA